MPNGTSDGMQDSMDISGMVVKLAWRKQQMNAKHA